MASLMGWSGRRRWLLGLACLLSLVTSADAQGLQQVQELTEEMAALYAQGDWEEAVVAAEQALALSREHLGDDSATTTSCLNNLAFMYKAIGRFEQAAPLYEECLTRMRAALGRDHPNSLAVLNNLASLYEAMGMSTEAEQRYRECLEAMREALGPEHPATLVCLSNLAGVYLDQGRYDDAQPLAELSFETSNRALGPDDPSTHTMGNALALLYFYQGRYSQASTLLEEIISHHCRLLGRDHPETQHSLSNLAAVYEAAGRYEAAELLFEECHQTSEQARGPEHPDTLAHLHSLASLYSEQGRYPEAEAMLQRCVSSRRHVLGAEHPDTLYSLHALANVFALQGRPEDALPLLEELHVHFVDELGPQHPDVLTSLGNLASSYADMGRNTEAESLYLVCLEQSQRILGEDHPDTLASLGSLSAHYFSLGRFQDCEPLLRRSLTGTFSVFGEDHPRTLARRNDLALLLQRTGRLDQATAQWLDVTRGATGWLEGVLPGLSRTARAEFLAAHTELETPFRIVLGLAARGLVAPEQGLARLLWRKGLLMRIATRIEQLAALAGGDPAVRLLVDALADARSRYAQLTVSGPPTGALPEHHRAQLKKLREQILELERDLARAVPASGPQPSAAEALERLRANLRPDEALVFFAAHQALDAQLDFGAVQHYAAFVARRDTVTVVDLGPTDAIDAQIQRLRAGAPSASQLSAVFAKRARALYDSLWGPLSEPLTGVARVRISLDGGLHLVPFGALVNPAGSFLADGLAISRLPAGLEMLGSATAARADRSALIVGGVDYGETDAGFGPLAATAGEADSVAARLTRAGFVVERLAGRAAAETALVALIARDRPTVLHLATHGYFIAAGQLPGSVPHPQQRSTDGIQVAAGDPLALCGLALAGVNDPDPARNDDGRLSAYEVLGLPLQATQLVVLSACNTGVGAVQAGESAGSLAEAFLRAGARSVLMSLWPIDDAATQAFMLRFYQRVAAGEQPAAALAAVQRECIHADDPELSSPRTWAAFVLMTCQENP